MHLKCNVCIFIKRFLHSNIIYYNKFSEKYFITTPIYYLNASPHIGHFYTNVLADTVARWKRFKKNRVIFSTGTDEHGQKVEEAAKRQKMEPGVFCDKMSDNFRKLFSASNVSFDKYIRTSDKKHKNVVKIVWNELMKTGSIYEGQYCGWYLVNDETFIHDESLISNSINNVGDKIKILTATKQPLHWVEEKNYIFKLTSFSDKILKIIEGDIIEPVDFKQSIISWIKSGLTDLSVSRHRSRLSWGIEVPDNPDQLIYVWLDALLNYLTAADYPNSTDIWPADCHVVGKDILKFHSVYWLAFLLALELPLPKKIICHSHWTINREKMSKSKGNVINPFDRISKYTPDGLRYYMLKESSLHSDSNYNDDKAIECINADLVNTYGNLLSRSTGKILNPNQIVPNLEIKLLKNKKDVEMIDQLYRLADIIDPLYSSFKVNHAIEIIMNQLRHTNAFFEYQKPWKLDQQNPALSLALAVALETLRITSLALLPVIPDLASKALDRLNIDDEYRTFEDMKKPIQGRNLNATINNVLLPRLTISN